MKKDKRELELCVVCKEMFVKGRGLKIHQAKSGCGKKKPGSHRIANKSETKSVRDTNHSGAHCHVNQGTIQRMIGPMMEAMDKEKGESRGERGDTKQGDVRKEGVTARGTKKVIEDNLKVLRETCGRDYKDNEHGRSEEREGTNPRIEQDMNIHIEESLYDDIVSLMEDKETNPKKAKKTRDKESKPSADIRKWCKKVQQTNGQSEGRAENTMKEVDMTVDEERAESNSQHDRPQAREIQVVRIEDEERREIVISQETKTTAGDEREVIMKPPDSDMRSVRSQLRELNVEEGSRDEVLARNELSLTRADFESLSGMNYLNDKVIDDYLSLIAKRNRENPSLPKVYAVFTHLYTTVETMGMTEGFERTKTWIKEDLREQDMILFPINEKHHWSLVIVETDNKTVNYMDSIRGSRRTSGAPGRVKKYMEEYYKSKGETAVFKTRRREDAPVQTNGVDCGVFVCQIAERATRRCSINCRQEDMAATRTRMAEELLTGRIFESRPQNFGNASDRKTNQGEKEERRKTKTKEAKPTNSAPRKKEESKKTSAGVKGREDGRKDKINWPTANSTEWKRLDEDLITLLKVLYSSPEHKAETHPRMIHAMCKERFGVKEAKKQQQPGGPSKRQKKCASLREEINTLKRTYKNAPDEEKEAINQLQEEKLKALRLTKRAETAKKNRKKYSSNCSKFLSQPFDFARETIAPKAKGEMKSSKEEVEMHLRTAHSDQRKGEDRSTPDDLHSYEEPTVSFNNEVPSWAEFNRKLRKTRSKSAPGPNGVPYLVYKRCPGVAKLLWLYLRGMWKKNLLSESWRKAEGILIPKEDGATAVEKFRTISLLNVEGKLYFALRADRLLTFTMANKYIDTSIQKGGVPAISGCLEHTAILSQLIREAKTEKKDLVVTWLDIANAYGTIPHSLIQVALKRAHVPDEFCNLVESYYADMKIRFTTKEYTTEWQQVEKGIITGCTLSVILFSLTMTMLVMSAKEETKGPKTSSGQQQVNSRIFIDDIATTTGNMVQTKYLLNNLNGKLKWAGLSVKPEKCRSLVIIKGEVSNRTPEIDGNPITSITEKSVKYLGKTYNKSLNEREQTEEILKEVKQGLKKIGKTRVPGRYKCWMVQHMLLPRVMWPLTIYNVPESKVEEIQRVITAALKRWLGLPKSLSTDCMYTKSGKLQLPYSELTEDVKAAKARLLTTLEEAADPCVRGANVNVDGGRKADTPKNVQEAKSKLRMEEITGIPNKGREGLGMRPKRYYSSSTKKERRAIIVNAVRDAEEDRRRVKMTSLAKQGAHTRWEVPEKKLTHKEILSRSETSLKFLVKAVYDLLPTPSNKNQWFGSEETCKLCGGNGTLAHILSGCKVALAQGRYKWRHDEVLRVIAQGVEERRKTHNNTLPIKETIKFVKAGERTTPDQKRELGSYLDGTTDWKMMVDLEGNLKFPKQVAVTNLRPDMILMSNRTKRIGLIELTVPSEERIEVSGELKKAKYTPLQEEGKSKGWKVQVWAVEVGCKGFPAASMASFLKEIGTQGGDRTKLLKRIGEAAESSSRMIWNWSHFKDWGKEK